MITETNSSRHVCYNLQLLSVKKTVGVVKTNVLSGVERHRIRQKQCKAHIFDLSYIFQEIERSGQNN